MDAVEAAHRNGGAPMPGLQRLQSVYVFHYAWLPRICATRTPEIHSAAKYAAAAATMHAARRAARCSGDNSSQPPMSPAIQINRPAIAVLANTMRPSSTAQPGLGL